MMLGVKAIYNGILNNFINIKITEFDGDTLWEDTYGYIPADSVLCLRIELIDKL